MTVLAEEVGLGVGVTVLDEEVGLGVGVGVGVGFGLMHWPSLTSKLFKHRLQLMPSSSDTASRQFSVFTKMFPLIFDLSQHR